MTTPHKTPIIRPLASHHENYTSQTNHTRRTLLKSKDDLISYVLLWTPTYGQAKAGRPARTYIQQLYEDTGCNPEDLPEAMNNREKWRERVRDIRAGSTTWWWWCYIYIYIYIYISCVQSQVASCQSLLKWYLIPRCLILSNIRYVSRVK